MGQISGTYKIGFYAEVTIINGLYRINAIILLNAETILKRLSSGTRTHDPEITSLNMQ